MAAFISSVPENGPVIVCGEEPSLVEVARSTGRAFLTYGFDADDDIQIVSYEPRGISSDFTLRLPNGQVVESCIPQNPGRHNVLNAAGAIGLIDALGLSAADAAQALFAGGAASQNVPSFEVAADELAADGRITTLLASCGLCKSRGEARKMVESGAVAVNEEKVTDINFTITAEMIGTDGLLLRKGKKGYCRLLVK